jgi:hypothetical protein
LSVPGKYCQPRVEWLRTAASDGFHAIKTGDYAVLRSGREIEDFVRRASDAAAADFAAPVTLKSTPVSKRKRA